MASSAGTAIVTGGSSGIGLGIVRGLLERGFNVVAASRRIDASTLRSRGIADAHRLATVRADVGVRDDALRILEAAMGRYGGVDLLVNNAGTFLSRPFTSYREEDLEALLGTNLRGFFHLTQLVVAQMLQRRVHGSIVTITASIAEQPLATMPALLPILTKGALNAATRALALELAPSGIRVNAVSPGAVRTPLNEGAPEELLASLQPLGHPGQVSDVVEAVLYLANAPYVTGEILHVDGGMTSGRW